MTSDLLLMMLALLTWGLGDGMFYHFNTLYLEQLGASPERIGQVLGVAGALMTVVHLPVGRWVDRWGPHYWVWAGWAVGTLGGVVMALASGLRGFVLGLWIYHLSLFVMVPMQAYLSLVRGKLSLARVLTLTSAMFNLGTVLGPWLGGLIAARWGLGRVYAWAAGLFVLSTLMVLRTRDHPWNDGQHAAPEARASWRVALRQLPTVVWGFVAWVFIAGTLSALPQPLLPNFLAQRGLQVQDIGTLGTFYALGATASNLALGALPALPGLSAALVGQALAAGLTWWGLHPWAYRGAYFLFGGVRATRPLAQALGQDLTPAGQRGLTYGLVETAVGLSLTVAAPLAGWLYGRWPLGMFLAPAIALLGLPVLWRLYATHRGASPAH